MKPRRAKQRQPFVQVDVCPSDVGFVLSIGLMSVWVTHKTAEEILAALVQSLIVRDNKPPYRAKGRFLFNLNGKLPASNETKVGRSN